MSCTHTLARTPAALCAVLLAGCPQPRPDDGFEPNDTFAQATRLVLGVPIEGRTNQFNPDVFVVEAGPAQRLRFQIEDRGLENCPRFQAHGPGQQELLGQDFTYECSPALGDLVKARKAEGVRFEPFGAGGYLIDVPAAARGDYWLTITEDSLADNIFPLGWDYRLTATAALDP